MVELRGNPREIADATAHGGEAEMPPTGDPLSDQEVATISKWIKQGAKNDYKNNIIFILNKIRYGNSTK